MADRLAPVRWVSHYPKMLWAYRQRGEAGLQEMEERLRAAAADQPGGKFGKLQAAYVPSVPIPPFDWRHQCGHCRFWVDHGPGKPGECMIVGREDDPMGGKAIHEKAGCALFMPPSGEPAFSWFGEQLDPTGADVVRGEFHPEVDPTDPDPSRRRPTKRAGGPWAPAGRLVDVEVVAAGFAAPIGMEFHPTADLRYVADQQGLVYVDDADGREIEPLLDLREAIVDLKPQYDERGLLGIALHPDFPEDRRLFVRYSAPVREGTPPDFDHTEVLAAFEVEPSGRQVDPGTEETIMEVPSPQFNHNAGAIAFGPDGYCYVAMGDGGSEGDQGVGHVEGGNGQDVTENRLGAILRIDVDAAGVMEEGDRASSRPIDRSGGPAAWSGEQHYGIPTDNPLVDGDGVDELYAWGLRNPWRMSFDESGRLFVADVGQHLYEEIDVIEKGGNYGWPVREGYHCFDPETPSDPPRDCPEQSHRGEPLRDPILEYPHVHEGSVVGSAVIGGHVYEGSSIPALSGAYVFGDWATTQDRPSGRLFAAEPENGADEPWSMEELVIASTDSGRIERNVLGFGRGPQGEVYVLANETHVPKGDTGVVLRLTRSDGSRGR